MVQEYPNCTYHGCDIDDNTYKNIDVKQFIFSIGDITQRLPYEDSTFDFVHMRFFIAALREEDEWPAAISEAIRVTKPGGMIQMTEFNLQVNLFIGHHSMYGIDSYTCLVACRSIQLVL